MELDPAEAGPVPMPFTATAVNVYAVPFLSPGTSTGECSPAPIKPPGDEVTMYEVMADPPFESGAAKLTVACPSPAMARTSRGAAGDKSDGVTTFEADEAGPPPPPWLAVTVKV